MVDAISESEEGTMCWERLMQFEQPAASKAHPMPAVERPPSRRSRNAGTEGYRLEPRPAWRADAKVKQLKKAEEVTAEPLIGIPA